MRKNILLSIALLIAAGVAAQPQKVESGYYFLPQVSLLNGDHAVSSSIQVTGGIERKSWSFGLGAAIDYYRVRTTPVFADLRTYFGRNRSLFSYLNLGTDIAWPLSSQTRSVWIGTRSAESSFSNGLYTDIGFGYALRGKHKNGVVMSIGYSIKTTAETYPEVIYHPFPPYINEAGERKLDYTLNRLVLKLGLRL
ncbi:MAG: hypothetical protein NVSMB63_13810 [Sediminibacterium sp.]